LEFLFQIAKSNGCFYAGKPSWRRLILMVARGYFKLKRVSGSEFSRVARSSPVISASLERRLDAELSEVELRELADFSDVGDASLR